MKTWVSDNFPMRKLECQFFEECQFYRSGKCQYGKPCRIKRFYEGEPQTVRSIFKEVTENYIQKENLEFQVRLILDEK